MSARASISQDYWGDIKEDWGQRTPAVQLRSHGKGSGDPAESRGEAPVGGLGDEVPHAEAEVFFSETTHNICVKIQQTTVAVTRVDILNDITSKILGGITMDVPHKYWGTCPPCPIGIDAPA